MTDKTGKKKRVKKNKIPAQQPPAQKQQSRPVSFSSNPIVRQKRAPSSNADWAFAVANPLTSSPVHIPDQDTTRSALCTSYEEFYVVPTNISGNTTTHTGALLLAPYPNAAYAWCYINSNGFLQDSASGTGVTSSWLSTTNIVALTGGTTGPFGGKIRCVGLEAEIVYEGTELNRSGEYFAGQAAISRTPLVYTSDGTYDLLVSSIGNGGGLGISASDLKKALKNPMQTRVPNSGSVKFRWIPEGVPAYQSTNPTNWVGIGPRTPGVNPALSGFFVGRGQFGMEAGQSVLVILIEGDTVGSAATTGNTYAVTARWLWEVVPDQPQAIVSPLTPSPANAAMVDKALNMLTSLPVLTVVPPKRNF